MGEEDRMMNAPVAFRRFIEGSQETPYGEVDLSDLVTVAVTRIVEETPAAQVHYMFRNLGINIIMITDESNKVVGMITKKSFIHHMEELHVQHGLRDRKAMKTQVFSSSDLNIPLMDDEEELEQP